MYQDHSQYQRDSLGQDKAKEDGQTRPKPVVSTTKISAAYRHMFESRGKLYL